MIEVSVLPSRAKVLFSLFFFLGARLSETLKKCNDITLSCRSLWRVNIPINIPFLNFFQTKRDISRWIAGLLANIHHVTCKITVCFIKSAFSRKISTSSACMSGRLERYKRTIRKFAVTATDKKRKKKKPFPVSRSHFLVTVLFIVYACISATYNRLRVFVFKKFRNKF